MSNWNLMLFIGGIRYTLQSKCTNMQHAHTHLCTIAITGLICVFSSANNDFDKTMKLAGPSILSFSHGVFCVQGESQCRLHSYSWSAIAFNHWKLPPFSLTFAHNINFLLPLRTHFHYFSDVRCCMRSQC